MDYRSLTRFTYFRGRVALYAILHALGIGKGDEVAIQAFTCLALPEAIMARGAKPIYIDIEPTGFNMDSIDLQRKLTSRTRAIVVQHTFGIPAELDSLLPLAVQVGIPVIEDCCHTLVSSYHGQTVGTFGVASFYSYEWGKPIVAGIGGSAVINDQVLARKMQDSYAQYRLPSPGNEFQLQLQYLAHRLLYRPALYWPVRTLYHALSRLGTVKGSYNQVGTQTIAADFSLRMAQSSATRLTRKLQQLDTRTKHSHQVANEYQAEIHSTVVRHPQLPQKCEITFARYPLLTSNKTALLAQAAKVNVELANWYSTPIHPVKNPDWLSVHYTAGTCPNAEERCQQIVTLPTHAGVSKPAIQRAVNFLNTVSV